MKTYKSRLNAPIEANKYLLYIIICIMLSLFIATVVKSIFLITALFISEIILVRRRLGTIGWSKWWSILCAIQLLTLFDPNDLAEGGQLLLYFILPGFIISLFYFDKVEK